MKFSLTTAGVSYKEGPEMDDLKGLGFTFKRADWLSNNQYEINDDDISIEINSLEELVSFTNKYGHVVFSEDTITIYDDWME